MVLNSGHGSIRIPGREGGVGRQTERKKYMVEGREERTNGKEERKRRKRREGGRRRGERERRKVEKKKEQKRRTGFQFHSYTPNRATEVPQFQVKPQEC